MLQRYLKCFAALAAITIGLTPAVAQKGGTTRTYYIAADELDWNYAPAGKDVMHDHPLHLTVNFSKSGKQTVPTTYRKAVYREYTDGKFDTLKERPPEWRHLGILGPLLRAEVGDTIRIVFRNNGSHPYSMHPHGVFYDKDSEGAPYVDGTSGRDKADDAVPPGRQHVYTWEVHDRTGPGPDDGSSVIWTYHSHTDEIRDVNSGLVGAMIITRAGMARPDGRPKDVDREFITMFGEFREDQSLFVKRNLPLIDAGEKAGAAEGSLGLPFYMIFTINGFVHGNLPVETLTMKKGERVRWYTFASSIDFDFHTPHWHGNTVLVDGKSLDLTSLMPMQTLIADMKPDNPGIWMLHCHVSDHMAGGMMQRFAVVE